MLVMRDKCLHLYPKHSSRSNYLLISISRPFTIQFLWDKLMKEVQYDHSISRGRLTNWITHLIDQARCSSFRFLHPILNVLYSLNSLALFFMKQLTCIHHFPSNAFNFSMHFYFYQFLLVLRNLYFTSTIAYCLYIL